MTQPSIRRRLIVWTLGVLGIGMPLLLVAAYLITLGEIDEVLDDSLRQTALLLADRDLVAALPVVPPTKSLSADDTESKLVAIARRPDGALLFTSQPELVLSFSATPGHSVQRGNGAVWHVFTVVQADRTIQVAQPASVRSEGAAESASQLLLPLSVLVAVMGGLVLLALRRGLLPLRITNDAIAQRSANSLAALEVRDVPAEVLPMVRAFNELLARLEAAFDAQRSFVADAAHELRTPVTALQLQIQILERSRDAAEQAAATAALSAGIARMRRLIEQLLDLSRTLEDDRVGATVDRQTVRLGELARSVVASLSESAQRRGIDLGARVDSEATVQGNAAQLEMLLRNLVENALKYTQPGGIVDVVVETLDGAPALRVIDNGPGIPVGEEARIFDRFYRSPQVIATAEPGSGLGLAIVRAIADRHGAVASLHGGRGGVGVEVRILFAAFDSSSKERG